MIKTSSVSRSLSDSTPMKRAPSGSSCMALPSEQLCRSSIASLCRQRLAARSHVAGVRDEDLVYNQPKVQREDSSGTDGTYSGPFQ